MNGVDMLLTFRVSLFGPGTCCTQIAGCRLPTTFGIANWSSFSIPLSRQRLLRTITLVKDHSSVSRELSAEI